MSRAYVKVDCVVIFHFSVQPVSSRLTAKIESAPEALI